MSSEENRKERVCEDIVNVLEGQISELKNEIYDHNGSIEEMNLYDNILNKEIAKLRELLDGHHKELDKIAELKKSQKDLWDLMKAHNKNFTELKERIECMYDIHTQDYFKLEKQIAELRKKFEDEAQVNEQIDQEHTEQIAELKESQKDLWDLMKAHNKNFTELKEQIKYLNINQGQCFEKRGQFTKQINELKEFNERTINFENDLGKQFNKLKEQIYDHNGIIKEMKLYNNILNKQIADLQDRINKLEKNVMPLDTCRQCAMYDTNIDKLKKRFNSQLELWAIQGLDFEEKMKKLKEQINELKEPIGDLFLYTETNREVQQELFEEFSINYDSGNWTKWRVFFMKLREKLGGSEKKENCKHGTHPDVHCLECLEEDWEKKECDICHGSGKLDDNGSLVGCYKCGKDWRIKDKKPEPITEEGLEIALKYGIAKMDSEKKELCPICNNVLDVDYRGNYFCHGIDENKKDSDGENKVDKTLSLNANRECGDKSSAVREGTPPDTNSKPPEPKPFTTKEARDFYESSEPYITIDSPEPMRNLSPLGDRSELHKPRENKPKYLGTFDNLIDDIIDIMGYNKEDEEVREIRLYLEDMETRYKIVKRKDL